MENKGYNNAIAKCNNNKKLMFEIGLKQRKNE